MTERYFGRTGYRITTNSFRGPTVYGECRGLCSVMLDSINVIDPPQNCVPARLVRKGVRTLAVHGNDASFYRRNRWISRIGFQNFYDKKLLAKEAEAERTPVTLDSHFDVVSDSQALPIMSALAFREQHLVKFYYLMSISSHGLYL